MHISIFKNKRVRKSLLVYFVFLISSLLLFWPVLHKNFGSDDFSVLYRDVYYHHFFTRDFFRPLSDITLYCSYLMGGFNPVYYNLFNVAVHACCCYMLYHFCLMNNGLAIKNRSFFAWFSAILFLIYPFHNESVVWVLGRASVTSCFFGFLSLITAFCGWPSFKKYYLSGLFYFIGLCGYETILPLPAIILLLLCSKQTPVKKYIPVAAVYACALAGNVALRYFFSGVVFGVYGGKMFEHLLSAYLLKFFKTAGRLFLPPSNHSLVLGGCFVIIIIIVSVLSVIIIKRRNKESSSYTNLTLALLLSCGVPLMFGLSTRTYEGDRVFYFTSFFLCMWIAHLADLFSYYKFTRWIKISIVGYFIFFFYQGIFAWKKAGEITSYIITTAKEIKRDSGNIFFINLPEEYNGAQVLRTSFTEALLINRADTAGIKVINYITTEYALKTYGIIKPVNNRYGIYLPPNAFISSDSIVAKIRVDANDSIHVGYKPADKIYYWSNEKLVLLNNPFSQRNK